MSFNVAGSSAEWQQQCHHCRGAGASLPRERQLLALRDLPRSQDWGKKKPHRLKPPPLISFECPREQKDLPCLQRKMVLVAAPGGSDGGTGVFMPPDCHCPPSWELWALRGSRRGWGSNTAQGRGQSSRALLPTPSWLLSGGLQSLAGGSRQPWHLSMPRSAPVQISPRSEQD